MDKSLFALLVQGFENNRNNQKAVQMKAYMKGQFDYFGLSSPLRIAIQKEILNHNKDLFNQLDLKHFVQLCWDHLYRELQYSAMDIMRKRKKELSFIEDLPFLLNLVKTKSWWDTVDFLASFHIGFILSNNPAIKSHYILDWISDKDMWIRRTAILCQLKMKEQTDFEILSDCILLTAHEKDFFIRKASGWALREYSKTDAPAVLAFVEANKAVLSGLTVREALKWMKKKI